MGNLKIKTKVNTITELRNLVGALGGSTIDVLNYNTPNEPTNAVYLKVYDTGVPDDGGGYIRGVDGLYKLISKVVTPYMFGAIQRDPSTTANLQRFFDFWITETDKTIIADFQGSWWTDNTIIIEGDNRTFTCGGISYKGDDRIANVVHLRVGNSNFKGSFGLAGFATLGANGRRALNGLGLNSGFSVDGVFGGVTDAVPAAGTFTITTDLLRMNMSNDLINLSSSSASLVTRKYVQSDDKQKYVAFTQTGVAVDMTGYTEVPISKLTYGSGGIIDTGATIYTAVQSKRNTFDEVSVSYVDGWGIDLRGSVIFNSFGATYFYGCGGGTYREFSFNYDWDYLTPATNSIPAVGQIIQADDELGIMRISKTADLSVDARDDLAFLEVGSKITVGTKTWTISSFSEESTYFEFGVTASQWGTTGVQNFSFSQDGFNNRLDVTINSVLVKGGTTGSVSQYSKLEIANLPQSVEAFQLMYIGGPNSDSGRWHFIDSIDRTIDGLLSTINVFPWVNPDLTFPYRNAQIVTGGGVVLGGGDVAGISFNSIGIVNSGMGVRAGGLYGIRVGNYISENCKVNIGLGYARSGVNFGSQFGMYYREDNNDSMDIFGITRDLDSRAKLISTNRRGYLITETFTAALDNGSIPSKGNILNMAYPMMFDNKVIEFDLHNQYSKEGNGNYTSGRTMNNLGFSKRYLTNEITLSTQWYEGVNAAAGTDNAGITLVGTGLNGAPTGEIRLRLGDTDLAAGRTINGGTEDIIVPTEGRSGIMYIIWVYQYNTNDWKVGWTGVTPVAESITDLALTTIDLSTTKYINMAGASGVISYTATNGTLEKYAQLLINAGLCEVSNANQLPGSTFVAFTDMYMIVTWNGVDYEYYFEAITL